jgi:pyruvate dehydrogenase E2 component (dihydrolipoamide acetyltransferase)
MISEVVMPQMGADMTEGTVLRWLKHEGDEVDRGEIIAEIETDKANVEIEAFEGGTFRKALAEEGDVVKVGEVIAVIGATSDDVSQYGASTAAVNAAAAVAEPAAITSAPTEVSPTVHAQPTAEQPPTPAPPAGVHHPQPTTEERQPEHLRRTDGDGQRTNGRIHASPLARRIAGDRGVDLGQVRGSGPGGRILRHDVEEFAQQGHAPSAPMRAEPAGAGQREQPAAVARPQARRGTSAGEVMPMSRMRQAIARRMAQSKREAPHYYLLVDIDMTDALALRRQLNDAQNTDEARVSINDLIVKACAIALQRHPRFNATIAGDEVTQHAEQNVCMAIALEEGLIAPAVLDVGQKGLPEIARETKDLVLRAKGGALRAEELSDGTFTITNLGAYGIETLIGIIQPPQTAILGVGSVLDQPAVREGVVGVKQLMKVALSADHRVTDGAQGAQFLGEIKALLEQPIRLLL